jgi:DNA-binding NtrC family response regulator
MAFRAVILEEPGWPATPAIEEILRREGVAVERRSRGTGALDEASEQTIDAFFLLTPASGAADVLATISRIRAKYPRCPIVLVAGGLSTDTVLAAFRGGADDVVPLEPEDALRESLDRLGLRHTPAPKGEQQHSFAFGPSRAMQEVERDARRAAISSSTVLITGETGTGKELAARFIHEHSLRANGPLVSINCAAIPEALLESELFGHDKGAFTGAVRNQMGAFELARGGTVFLDEVGELALAGQVKLLRALESRSIRPLGAQRDRLVDVRVIAATNQNIESRVEQHLFRPDLYFRLNVVRLDLPPLRARREDLPYLVRYHLSQLCKQMSRPLVKLSPDLMERLFEYEWPGNIRELRNFLEGTLVHAAGDVVDVSDTPRFVRERLCSAAAAGSYERNKILDALNSVEWNKSKAATILRCSRMTLYRKMARYHIQSCE